MLAEMLTSYFRSSMVMEVTQGKAVDTPCPGQKSGAPDPMAW
jgi:hypothetical protein